MLDTTTSSLLGHHGIVQSDSLCALYDHYEAMLYSQFDNDEQINAAIDRMLFAMGFYCKHAKRAFRGETLLAFLAYFPLSEEQSTRMALVPPALRDGVEAMARDYGALLENKTISSPNNAKQAFIIYKCITIACAEIATQASIGIEEDDWQDAFTQMLTAYNAGQIKTHKPFDDRYMNHLLRTIAGRFDNKVGYLPHIHVP